MGGMQEEEGKRAGGRKRPCGREAATTPNKEDVLCTEKPSEISAKRKNGVSVFFLQDHTVTAMSPRKFNDLQR
jgi:hypothetical protein